MARSETTRLDADRRDADGSRAVRRLRREGRIPGVVYGGGDDPVPFAVDARALRQAIHHGGAVIDLSIDGAAPTPVVVKDQQTDPVKGATVHVDLLRVRLDKPIHATTVLELTGAEEAPGVKEGGVLSQETRELNIEALPTDIPDQIVHDVSSMEINETMTLAAVAIPPGVTLLDDPDETVIATITPPTAEPVEEEEEIEEETELVGEEEAPAEAAEGAEAAGEGGEEAAEGG
jgi:large subunit ribosomal protein L25